MIRILYVIILALIATPALADEPTKEEITPPIIIHLKDMLTKDKDDDLPYKSKFDIQKADESLRKYDLSIVEISGSDNEENKDKVNWDQLSRLDNKKKVLMAEPLVSDKQSKEDDLAVNAKGDVQNVEVALRVLFMSDEELEEEIKKSNKYDVPLNNGSNSSNDNGIDKSPISINEKEEQVSYRQEACPVRIDWDNYQVYQQAEVIKSVNGTDTERQGCQDSDFPSEILNSYQECKDEINLSEMLAYRMYKPYYLYNGEQTFLKDCIRDDSQFFDIKQSFDCTIAIDMQNKVATEYSYLFYKNHEGINTTVSECQPREDSRTFPIEFTYNTCSYRVDEDKVNAYQQGKYYYVKDGISTDVTICQDSDLVYPIEKEFCEYKESWKDNLVFKYEKDKIQTINGLVYLTDCRPTKSTAIIETIDGCETLHQDYFDGGYSKGFSRFYYLDDNKNMQRTYLTECKENSEVYAHHLKIMDWIADFDKMQAVSLVAYFIDLPSGTVQITEPKETKDSIRVPLAMQDSKITRTERSSTNGCIKYIEQEKTVSYLLPNDKIVYKTYPTDPITETICTESSATKTIVYKNASTYQKYETNHGKISTKNYRYYYTDTFSFTVRTNLATGEKTYSEFKQISHKVEGLKLSDNKCSTCSLTCGSFLYDPSTSQCINSGVYPL